MVTGINGYQVKVMVDVQPAKNSEKGDNASIPRAKKIIRNGPATIVYWQDGTRTVVKCMDGTPYDEYAGFCAAVCKKLYGSSSAICREAGLPKGCHKAPVEAYAEVNPVYNTGGPVTHDEFSKAFHSPCLPCSPFNLEDERASTRKIWLEEMQKHFGKGGI